MYVGKKLKELRVSLDKNQTEMADSLGVSQSYYSSIEKGKKPVTQKMLDRIVTLYKVDRGYFEYSNDNIEAINKGVEIGGNIGGDGNNIAFSGYFEENKLAYYINHANQRLEGLLFSTYSDLKEAIDTYNKLIDFLIYFKAPSFILEKYSDKLNIEDYNEEIEYELTNELKHITDNKVINAIKIVRYEDTIDHVMYLLKGLVKYIDLYKDMFNSKHSVLD